MALDNETDGGFQGCQVQLAAQRYEYGQMMVTGRQSLFRLRIPPKEFLGFGKGQESRRVNTVAPSFSVVALFLHAPPLDTAVLESLS